MFSLVKKMNVLESILHISVDLDLTSCAMYFLYKVMGLHKNKPL